MILDVASVHFECFMLLVCVSVKPLYPILASRPVDRNTYAKQGDALKSIKKKKKILNEQGEVHNKQTTT